MEHNTPKRVDTQPRQPRICVLDIENAPSLGWVWETRDTNVVEVEREWFMLSFAYKWFGKRRVHAHSLPEYPIYKKDPYNDVLLVKRLWEVLDSADAVCGHNLDRFDVRKANAKFFQHGLSPPSPYQTVDTLKVYKKNFKENSNSLQDIVVRIGLGKKEVTGGWPLWKGCINGDPKSWNKMVRYNKKDIVLTEKLYKRLIPWIHNSPNANLFTQKNDCPKLGCGGHMVRDGTRKTKTRVYQQWKCMKCAGYASSTIKGIIH